MIQVAGWTGATVEHLPAALMHSLWQGLLVTLLVFLLLRRIPVTKPELRYGVAVAGLIGVVLALLITWSILERPPNRMNASPVTVTASSAESAPSAPPTGAAAPSSLRTFDTHSSLSSSDYLLIAWLAGAALMLLRVVWLLRGTRSLRKRCRVPDAPVLRELMEEVKAAMGMTRRVAVLVADELVSPIAMGLFWPVVVMPVAMATGLTPDQLRAVLAHELAHIRRYDYLVNFFQLIVEALLYFNPAVWWLSRHIRVEREACCDALAARISGGAIDYAAALAQIARSVHGGAPLPALAQGFGAERGPGGILDRTRRLLLPGYWPKLRLRWYSLALGALISVAMLLGLYQSSVLSVAFMGWVFSDKERIEVMSHLSQEYNSRPEPEDYDKLEKVEVSGTLITTDGKPLPKPERGNFVHTLSQRKTIRSQSSISGGVELEGNRFHAKMTVGDLYFFAEFPGYAPTAVGPLHGDAQHPVENVEIRLEPSQPATIRFVDVNGAPIAGVKVDGFYEFLPNTGSWSLHGRSDNSGVVQFDQAKRPVPMSLEVTAKGYAQARNADLVVAGGQRYDWALQPEEPFDVYVVDKRNGAPIAGAEVALVYERGRGFKNDENGTVLATSDDSGHAVLHGRNRNQMYALLVRAHGFGTELIRCSQETNTPMKVALAPRYVRGTIRGDLTLLKKGEKDSGPVVTSSMPLVVPGESTISAGESYDTPVTVKDGEGSFSIDDLRAGDLSIKAGTKQVQVSVGDPVEDLEIIVGAAKVTPYRPLVIETPVPDGAPAAKGNVGIEVLSDGSRFESTSRKVEIANGRGTTSIPVPARVRIVADGLAGYIPKPLAKEDRDLAFRGWDVPEGTEPFVISLPLERAGAIYGKVLKADGTPDDAQISATPSPHSGDVRWPYDYLCGDIMNTKCNERGEFAILPIPLDTDFEIAATIGFATEKKTLRLSALKPIAREQLQLPQGIDATVRVLNPDGSPATEIPLTIETSNGRYSGMRTDSEGRYVLHGIDAKQECWALAEPGAMFQYVRAKVSTDGAETVIRLIGGLGAEGVVLGSGTEKAIPNHHISAVRKHTDSSTWRLPVYRVETVTDHEGKFRFSNLAPGEYVVMSEPSRDWSDDASESSRNFSAGQKESVIVHVHPSSAGPK